MSEQWADDLMRAGRKYIEIYSEPDFERTDTGNPLQGDHGDAACWCAPMAQQTKNGLWLLVHSSATAAMVAQAVEFIDSGQFDAMIPAEE